MSSERRYALIGHSHAASAEVNDLTAAVTWADIPIANVPTGTSGSTVALGNHTHTLAAGITDVTATAAEVNLLDLSGLTAGWVLSADTASTASWKAPAAGGATQLDELSDVVSATNTNRFALMANGTTGFVGRALVEADISDLGSYITASSSDSLTNKTFNANGTGNSLSNVDVADLANGTDGELITWSAAGAPTTVPVGTATHVLTSNGAGAAPTFQAPAGGGFTPKPVMYVGSGSGAISATTAWVTVDLATEYYDTESNYSLATDIITVTDAGYYLISYTYTYHPTGGATNDSIKCRMTKNGTTTVLPGSTTQGLVYKANTRPCQVTNTFLASLAASDTVRLQQACETGTTGTELGTSINVTLVKVG